MVKSSYYRRISEDYRSITPIRGIDNILWTLLQRERCILGISTGRLLNNILSNRYSVLLGSLCCGVDYDLRNKSAVVKVVVDNDLYLRIGGRFV